MLKFLSFIAILLIAKLLPAQSTHQGSERIFTATQLKSDFEIVVQSLKEIHPALYLYLTEDQLNTLSQSTSEAIMEGMTELEFHILVRKFIRSIRCGHTAARISEVWAKENNKDLLLPMDVILIEDRMFIREALDKETTLIQGTEILSINQKPTKQILEEIRSIQELDGYTETYDNHRSEDRFNAIFKYFNKGKTQHEIEYLDKQNEKQKIVVQAKTAKEKTSIEVDKAALKISGASYLIHNEVKDLATLTLDNFTSNKYKKYYKTIFEDIQNREINHLVIDLRGNGGGYFPHGNYLLRYLMEDTFYMRFSRAKDKIKKQPYHVYGFLNKLTQALFGLMPDTDKSDPARNYALKYKPMKKNPFKGQVYVLINGGSFSMASLVASKLNGSKTSTLIGEETGGGNQWMNALLKYQLVLPETKIRVWIPRFAVDQEAQVVEEGRGVMPDLEVKYELNDILEGRDKEMEQVLLLIKKS